MDEETAEDVVRRLVLLEGNDVLHLLGALDDAEEGEYVMNVFELDLNHEVSTVVIHDITDPDSVTEMDVGRFRSLLQDYWSKEQ